MHHNHMIQETARVTEQLIPAHCQLDSLSTQLIYTNSDHCVYQSGLLCVSTLLMMENMIYKL
ncbi:hypothetical protein E2C01_082289 [Portunus trituberculatus]|uniref:Uncharacterized protein n=1 Tax=Portunus trituberculatus TaxID=210409 RepID=A0A5B7J172_PORTR|nr:hypothetical protein [Portunus trituberculatus]